jgi:hypothetical protein
MFTTIWEKGQNLNIAEVVAGGYYCFSFRYVIDQEADLLEKVTSGIVGRYFEYQGHSCYFDKITIDRDNKLVHFYIVIMSGTPAVVYIVLIAFILGIAYLSLVSLKQWTNENPAAKLALGAFPIILLLVGIIVLIRMVKD